MYGEYYRPQTVSYSLIILILKKKITRPSEVYVWETLH